MYYRNTCSVWQCELNSATLCNLSWKRQWNFGFHKRWRMFWPVDRLSESVEYLCRMSYAVRKTHGICFLNAIELQDYGNKKTFW